MPLGEKLYSGLNKSLLFVERYWKEILGVLIALVIILSISKCHKDKTLIHDVKTVSKFNDTSYTSEITKWKDAYNKEHVRAENLTVSNTAMQLVADSLSRVLKIKISNVISVSKVGSQTSLHETVLVDSDMVSVPCPIAGISDRVVNKNFKWQDKWMQVSGTVGDYGNFVDVFGKDSLIRIDYSERAKILGLKIGAKRNYTDVSNSNPHISITGYKGLQLNQAKSNWSVGVGIHIGYPLGNINLYKPAIFVGIGLQYSLFKF